MPPFVQAERAEKATLRRGHFADDVFAALAAEILRGDLEVGGAFPSERQLSERFGISKLVVRQAVHRLAEAGLVDVRQGGTTRVRDPDDLKDLRALELLYRLAPESDRTRALAHDVLEKQFTQGLSLVCVFARRASADARAALVTLVDGGESERDDAAKMLALEERFWTKTAEACGNRILRAEVRWWYSALESRPEMPKPPSSRARWEFYRELARRLRDDEDALGFYLTMLTPGIAALFPAPGKKTTARARTKRTQ